MRSTDDACIRWNGWLTLAQVAWLKKRANAQPYRTSPASVLRAVLSKAMAADEKKKRTR